MLEVISFFIFSSGLYKKKFKNVNIFFQKTAFY